MSLNLSLRSPTYGHGKKSARYFLRLLLYKGGHLDEVVCTQSETTDPVGTLVQEMDAKKSKSQVTYYRARV